MKTTRNMTDTLTAARWLDAHGYNCTRVTFTLWHVTYPDGKTRPMFGCELIKLAQEAK
jgi:hypothetical protein